MSTHNNRSNRNNSDSDSDDDEDNKAYLEVANNQIKLALFYLLSEHQIRLSPQSIS